MKEKIGKILAPMACAAFVLVFVSMVAADYLTSVTVTEGAITALDVTLSPYGMVNGTIVFKIEDIEWYPDEVWLVPTDAPDDFEDVFEYTSKHLTMNSSECKTGLYFNETYGYAYKVTSSQINQGNFCALAYNGTYKVFVS